MRLACARGLLLVMALIPTVASAGGTFIGGLNVSPVGSTVPSNGDVNPYGVAVVPVTTGALVKGHILVSNFNNSSNLQGTGTTIVDLAPDGTLEVFAHLSPRGLPGACPGGVGLTTAVAVLRKGWVIVGSLPTSDGTAATAKAGCLIVLNSEGRPVRTFSGGVINGPWDMTALDGGSFAVLFVANVLNGTVAANGATVNRGTVVRILLFIPDGAPPVELRRTVVASGFGERTDPSALVIGPTGLGLSHEGGTLYVADTLASRIAAISDPLTRTSSGGAGDTVSAGLNINGPLGMAIAPNGDILTANAGDGNLVETTPAGAQVAVSNIDTTMVGAGTLFGIALAADGSGLYFVNDGNNTLNLLH